MALSYPPLGPSASGEIEEIVATRGGNVPIPRRLTEISSQLHGAGPTIDHVTWTGPVTAFELAGDDGEFTTGSRISFKVGRSGLVTHEDVSELERLWNDLPVAAQARCHIPLIGFEVRHENELELRAALCFQCCNISSRSPEGDHWRSFDPTSDQAQSILRILESALPHE